MRLASHRVVYIFDFDGEDDLFPKPYQEVAFRWNSTEQCYRVDVDDDIIGYFGKHSPDLAELILSVHRQNKSRAGAEDVRDTVQRTLDEKTE